MYMSSLSSKYFTTHVTTHTMTHISTVAYQNTLRRTLLRALWTRLALPRLVFLCNSKEAVHHNSRVLSGYIYINILYIQWYINILGVVCFLYK